MGVEQVGEVLTLTGLGEVKRREQACGTAPKARLVEISRPLFRGIARLPWVGRHFVLDGSALPVLAFSKG